MAETGINQNWNRDYDPLTGKYIESDPVSLRGHIAKAKADGKATWILATGQAVPGAIPFTLFPNPYDYADQKPISTTDPTGRFGLPEVGVIVGGIAAAVVIYAIHECVKKCDDDHVCPYPRDSGDPVTDQNRNAWVTGCKQKCVSTFGELAKGGPW